MKEQIRTKSWDAWRIPIWIGCLALIVRGVALYLYPDAYQFDAYQRWAGRDHLYVQVWLPATQLIVWMVGKLGGDPFTLRVVFSVFGSITIAMMARLVVLMANPMMFNSSGVGDDKISDSQLAWMMVPLTVFGPYLVWSTIPYQESTLLFFLLLGLLTYNRNPWISNIAIGALALVRYEGWPLIIVHCLLRRDRYCFVSIWGMVLWGVIKYFHWLEPFMASPDSFSDWNELSTHLTPRKARHLFRQLWLMFDSSAAGWFLLSVIPVLQWWKKWDYRHWMLFWSFFGQCAALLGWLFSLGVAFSRMMVLPVLLMGVFSALGWGWMWSRFPGRKRILLIISLIGVCYWTLRDVYIDLSAFNKHNRWERALVDDINLCNGDIWSVYPRIHNGPRSRHDGCEVIQGLTNLRAGLDFNCIQWGWGGPEATMLATWNTQTEEYEIERVGGIPAAACLY